MANGARSWPLQAAPRRGLNCNYRHATACSHCWACHCRPRVNVGCAGGVHEVHEERGGSPGARAHCTPSTLSSTKTPRSGRQARGQQNGDLSSPILPAYMRARTWICVFGGMHSAAFAHLTSVIDRQLKCLMFQFPSGRSSVTSVSTTLKPDACLFCQPVRDLHPQLRSRRQCYEPLVSTTLKPDACLFCQPVRDLHPQLRSRRQCYEPRRSRQVYL